MQKIIFYYWKNEKIPKVPSSDYSSISRLFSFPGKNTFKSSPRHGLATPRSFYFERPRETACLPYVKVWRELKPNVGFSWIGTIIPRPSPPLNWWIHRPRFLSPHLHATFANRVPTDPWRRGCEIACILYSLYKCFVITQNFIFNLKCSFQPVCLVLKLGLKKFSCLTLLTLQARIFTYLHWKGISSWKQDTSNGMWGGSALDIQLDIICRITPYPP